MLAFLQLSGTSLNNCDFSALQSHGQSLSPPLSESHMAHGFEQRRAGKHITIKSEPALLHPALEQA